MEWQCIPRQSTTFSSDSLWIHCAKSCSDSPASHCGAPLSIPGQYTWDLLQKMRQWDWFFFSPSTSDFLCRRNFTSKVLHSPASFIYCRRCKTLTIETIVNIGHLSINHQTKRTSLNQSLEHYCYITLLGKLFEENVPQYRVFLISCSSARQFYYKEACFLRNILWQLPCSGEG